MLRLTPPCRLSENGRNHRNFFVISILAAIACRVFVARCASERCTPSIDHAPIAFAGAVLGRPRKLRTRLRDGAEKERQQLLEEAARLRAEAAAILSGIMSKEAAVKSAQEADQLLEKFGGPEKKNTEAPANPSSGMSSETAASGSLTDLERRYEEAVKRANRANAFQLPDKDKLNAEVTSLREQLDKLEEKQRPPQPQVGQPQVGRTYQPGRASSPPPSGGSFPPPPRPAWMGMGQPNSNPPHQGRSMAEWEAIAVRREAMSFEEEKALGKELGREGRLLLEQIRLKRLNEKERILKARRRQGDGYSLDVDMDLGQ